MLSGGGNAGERWKTTIGVISKKKLCTCSTLFLYISLPLSCMTTTWNFQKLLNYTFHGENYRTSPCSLFFFTSAHVHLALVAASISHFLTAANKKRLFFQQKNVSCVLLSLALENTDTERIPAFRFRVHWIIWVAIPVDWVIHVGMPVVRTNGRCTVTWFPHFRGWVVYHIFLPMVLRFAPFARELRYN